MIKKKLDGLQALRGFAALVVCFFHNRSNLIYNHHDYGSSFFEDGHVGVPIFFAISGFIMIYTTQKLSEDRLQNVKSFLFKRFIRIIQLYYFATFVFIIMCHNWYYFGSRLPELVKSLLFLPNNSGTPLYVGWTLNYEMFFYLVFGFCLFFRSQKVYVLAVIYTVLLIILPLLINIPPRPLFETDPHNLSFGDNILSSITNPIQLFFLAGVLIGILLPWLKVTYKLNYMLFFLAIALIAILYLKLFGIWNNHNPLNLVVIAALVLCFLLIDVSEKPLTIPRPFIFLGDISYSLYLIHPVTIIYLPGIAIKLGLGAYIKGPVFFCVWLIITIGSAKLMYRFIEIKFTRYIKIKLGNKTHSLANY